MNSSTDEVETLLAAIRARARAPEIARLTDQISVLCRAHLTPSPDQDWLAAGLTKMEARLMRALAEKPDRTVSKSALMDAMYFDRAREAEPKIVDVRCWKRVARPVKAPIPASPFSASLQPRGPSGPRVFRVSAGR